MKLNVFGKMIEIVRVHAGWKAFYFGNEGKKRPANDIVLPAHLKEADLVEYIADLCHEWASPANGVVRKLE